MAVVVTDDLVRFEVPALDHFIFRTTEQVRVSFGKGQPADGGDVPGQRQLQRVRRPDASLGQVPNLDRPVGRTRSKHVVRRIDTDRTDPTQVT